MNFITGVPRLVFLWCLEAHLCRIDGTRWISYDSITDTLKTLPIGLMLGVRSRTPVHNLSSMYQILANRCTGYTFSRLHPPDIRCYLGSEAGSRMMEPRQVNWNWRSYYRLRMENTVSDISSDAANCDSKDTEGAYFLVGWKKIFSYFKYCSALQIDLIVFEVLWLLNMEFRPWEFHRQQRWHHHREL